MDKDYTSLGICFGLLIGGIIGQITDDMSTWLPFGLLGGTVLGSLIEK